MSSMVLLQRVAKGLCLQEARPHDALVSSHANHREQGQEVQHPNLEGACW